MKINRSFYLFIIGIVLSINVKAQDEELLKPFKKESYVFSPRASITVPHPTGNRAFRKSFVGIYEVSGGLNVMLYKGLYTGFTYTRGFLKVMENKIPDLNTGMLIDNLSLKVGSDFYVGDNNRIIFSASISAGKNWTTFTDIQCKDSASKSLLVKAYTTTFIKPEINFFFLVDPNFGIGASISYTLYNRNFDPYQVCFQDWSSFKRDNPGATQYLSFGFGFYYNFLRKKK